jgi:type I restriction enzyme S subunit
VESLTGIQSTEKEKMKAPKTELVSILRLSKAPTVKDKAPLSAILLKHKESMSAKNLWTNSGMEIDQFYQQLKSEMANGWIVEPEKAYMKVVE